MWLRVFTSLSSWRLQTLRAASRADITMVFAENFSENADAGSFPRLPATASIFTAAVAVDADNDGFTTRQHRVSCAEFIAAADAAQGLGCSACRTAFLICQDSVR